MNARFCSFRTRRRASRLPYVLLGFVVLTLLAPSPGSLASLASIASTASSASSAPAGGALPGHSSPSTPGARATAPSLARAPSPTDLGMAYTVDPRVAGNAYLRTDLTVPQGALVPRENWTFLMAEPINSTLTVGVGLFGFQNGSSPTWWPEFFLWNAHGRPANTTVIDRAGALRAGQSGDLVLSWYRGSWWNFSVGGAPVQAPGNNGTVDLGAPSAVGYATGAPVVSWPSLLVEGNTTTLPFTVVLSSVLQFSPVLNPSDPVNTTWFPQNALWWQNAPGWQVGGEDQLGPFYPTAGTMWDLLLGANAPAAPANGTWLWGLGGPAFRPSANVTVQGAFAANTGFGVDLALNASSFGSPAASYLVTAWERPAPGVAVGVGAWVNAPGGQVIPYYTKNVSGESVQHVADANTPLPGRPEIVLAWAGQGGFWNFSDNGGVLRGGEASYALGDEFVGPTLSPAGSEVFVTIETVASRGVGTSSLDLAPAVLLNVSGSWVTPPEGWVGPTTPPPCSPCQGGPLLGYLQDPLLSPGEAEVSPSIASAPVGTVLWNGTAFLPVQVAWTGLPRTVYSFENLTTTLWVNGTSGPASGARLSLQLPSGVQSGTITYPSAGEVTIPLEFSAVGSPTPLSLSVEGGAPGYLPTATSLSTEVDPGTISVQGHLSVASLAPGASGTILLWANGTYGAGPRIDATVTARSSLGATLLAEGLQIGGTDYAFGYTAPSVEMEENDTVAILVSVPGFDPAVGLVEVPLVPPAMTLALHAAPDPVLAGTTVQVLAWLNASSGGPLSGAAFAAGFPAYGTLSAVTPTTPSPGVYAFQVAVPVVPANSTLILSVTATLAAYRTVAQLLPMSIDLPPLSAIVHVQAPQQGIYEIVVRATSGGLGVGGAVANLQPSGGTLTAPSLTTGPQGYANFTWNSPTGRPGTFVFSLTVLAAGYLPTSQTFTIVVPGSSAPGPAPAGLAWEWLLVAPAIVIAVFLVLWSYGRRRQARSGKGGSATQPAKDGERPGKSWASEELDQEDAPKALPSKDSGTKEAGPPPTQKVNAEEEVAEPSKDGRSPEENLPASAAPTSAPSDGAASPPP